VGRASQGTSGIKLTTAYLRALRRQLPGYMARQPAPRQHRHHRQGPTPRGRLPLGKPSPYRAEPPQTRDRIVPLGTEDFARRAQISMVRPDRRAISYAPAEEGVSQGAASSATQRCTGGAGLKVVTFAPDGIRVSKRRLWTGEFLDALLSSAQPVVCAGRQRYARRQPGQRNNSWRIRTNLLIQTDPGDNRIKSMISEK